MNLFGVLGVSGSALEAERVRAEVVASNMANAETTRTAEGGPYQRQQVLFEAATAESEQSFAAQLMDGLDPLSGRRLSPLKLRQKGADAAEGVAVAGIVGDGSKPLRRYDPGHPDAGADGYVSYPDINPLTEMVDLMGAQRSYGLNASAVQAEKSMIGTAIDLGKNV